VEDPNPAALPFPAEAGATQRRRAAAHLIYRFIYRQGHV